MTTEPLDLRSLFAQRAGSRGPECRTAPIIGHVHFHVGAIGEAEAFYHSVARLRQDAWSYPGALFLSAGGYHHHVGTNTGRQDRRPPLRRRRAAARVGAALPAADVDAAAASAAQCAGYDIREEGGDRLILTDPWGITVRTDIIQRSHS